jgi:hypothetical protein
MKKTRIKDKIKEFLLIILQSIALMIFVLLTREETYNSFILHFKKMLRIMYELVMKMLS